MQSNQSIDQLCPITKKFWGRLYKSSAFVSLYSDPFHPHTKHIPKCNQARETQSLYFLSCFMRDKMQGKERGLLLEASVPWIT